jgi:hypothetical protein
MDLWLFCEPQIAWWKDRQGEKAWKPDRHSSDWSFRLTAGHFTDSRHFEKQYSQEAI